LLNTFVKIQVTNIFAGVVIKMNLINWAKVKQLRINLNINQTEMAKKLGLRTQTLYAFYETGKAKTITQDFIDKLALALECKAEDFLRVDEIVLKDYTLDQKRRIASEQHRTFVSLYTEEEEEFLASTEGQQLVKKLMLEQWAKKAN